MSGMLAQSKRKAAIIVFVVALAVRLIYSFTTFQHYLNNDATGFHNLAINVARGNGYSVDQSAPYRPYFMREPGYPLFLASVYYVYSVIEGEPQYVTTNTVDLSQHQEIVWARVAQSIIGALTCVFFFLLISLRVKPTLSFCIALLASVYLPLAAFSAIMLRETLQTFLLVAMAYLLARFLQTPRWSTLAVFTIIWAISNLTLQITVLVFAPVFLFVWIALKSFRRSFVYTTASTLAMIALISPWLIRTYNFYPDVRVLRSLGTSLTSEARDWGFVQFSLGSAGLLSNDTVYARLHREFYDISEREKFERSFNGYYENDAAKGRAMLANAPAGVTVRKPVTAAGKAKQLVRYFRNSWLESLWVIETPNESYDLGPEAVYRAHGQTLLFILSLSGFLFGYAALPGMLLFFRRMLPILPMFLYFVALFPVIGDEERRGLPMHLFIILFSCLLFFYLYKRFLSKRSHREIIDEALLTPATAVNTEAYV